MSIRNISNPCQHRLAQANGGSTNTTRVHVFHALLLPYSSNITKYS